MCLLLLTQNWILVDELFTECSSSRPKRFCQTVKNKVADMAAIIEGHKPDIILGNESWLHPGIANNEVFPDGYNIYRKDRTTDNHGGVFLAVKKDIIATHRKDLNTDCESIWTQCQIQNKRSKSLFLCSYYRPSMNDANSIDELDASLFKLGEKLNKNNVIVAGDFNAPNINWTDHSTTNSSPTSERLLEIIDEHGLSQLVREPTRRQGDTQNILDLVLTNNDKIVNNIRVVPEISDHDIVLFQVNLACTKKRRVKRKIYIRKRANTDRIKDELQNLADHFEQSLKNESVETKWNVFQQRIRSIMDSCIPHKLTSSRHNLPWFNRSLRRQTRAKQKLYNKAKKSGSQSDWAKFRTARKQLHKNLKSSRDSYLSGFLGNAMQEPNPQGFLIPSQEVKERGCWHR